jgi:hypothetical protein
MVAVAYFERLGLGISHSIPCAACFIPRSKIDTFEVRESEVTFSSN